MALLSASITPTNLVTTSGAATLTNKTLTSPTVSGAVVSDGTANGVPYLNGSKVLTSGSALVFNGTNLGIGTSSPEQKLDVVGALNLRNSGRRGTFEIDSSGNLLMGTGTTAGNLIFETGHSGGDLPSTGTERVKINQYGIGLGVSTPSSGMGITFPATQSASSDANTLDDYEEGTFTATVVAGGTFSGLNEGRYTKIGRQVFVMLNPGTTAITGNIEFSGLPFTVASARSALVTAASPPAGVTYTPVFVDSTSIYINVTGTYSGGALSTYFAAVYQTS